MPVTPESAALVTQWQWSPCARCTAGTSDVTLPPRLRQFIRLKAAGSVKSGRCSRARSRRGAVAGRGPASPPLQPAYKPSRPPFCASSAAQLTRAYLEGPVGELGCPVGHTVVLQSALRVVQPLAGVRQPLQRGQHAANILAAVVTGQYAWAWQGVAWGWVASRASTCVCFTRAQTQAAQTPAAADPYDAPQLLNAHRRGHVNGEGAAAVAAVGAADGPVLVSRVLPGGTSGEREQQAHDGRVAPAFGRRRAQLQTQ